MATIQTPIRTITTKESYQEVKTLMDFKWMTLTEIDHYRNENGEPFTSERPITLNRDYIVEVT